MRLAPKLDYDQLIFSRRTGTTPRLVERHGAPAGVAEAPLHPVPVADPHVFKPLKQKYLRTDEHISFLLIEKSQTTAVIAHAERAGLACVYRTTPLRSAQATLHFRLHLQPHHHCGR